MPLPGRRETLKNEYLLKEGPGLQTGVFYCNVTDTDLYQGDARVYNDSQEHETCRSDDAGI
jgi:hypothetical protein